MDGSDGLRRRRVMRRNSVTLASAAPRSRACCTRRLSRLAARTAKGSGADPLGWAPLAAWTVSGQAVGAQGAAGRGSLAPGGQPLRIAGCALGAPFVRRQAGGAVSGPVRERFNFAAGLRPCHRVARRDGGRVR